MNIKALEILKLNKSFTSNFMVKKFHILNDITLSAEKGEIYGFLGPNGAGKTTTIKCILGLIFPDSGQISIDGQKAPSRTTRNKLGYLPEHPYFYDYLTPMELLSFTGRLFNIPKKQLDEKSRQLLLRVGLKGKEDIKLRKFSKGMVQRLGMAQALVHDPDLLILDEPFSGLDPIGRKEIRDIIIALKEAGKTIFFSSHILQDMEMIVDKVGIIRDGRVKKEGKLSELIFSSVQHYEIAFTVPDESTLAEAEFSFTIRDRSHMATAKNGDESNRIIAAVQRAGGKISAVTPVTMTLEDIFLKEINQ